MESTQKIVTQNPDSIEIGTPGRNGAIKVYGDYSNPEEFKKKIDDAIEIQKYANAQIQIKLGG